MSFELHPIKLCIKVSINLTDFWMSLKKLMCKIVRKQICC